MKTKILLASTAAALFTTLSVAQAADSVQIIDDVAVPAEQSLWYVSLFGGVSVPQDFKTDYSGNVNNNQVNSTITIDFNTGFTVGGTVGRQLTDRVRGEFEVSYAQFKADKYSYFATNGIDTESDSGPVTENVKLKTVYLLGNVWADVAQFGGAKLYVGGGLGAAYTKLSSPRTSIKDWTFAAQVGGGLTYALTSNLDLDLGYRFKGAIDVNYRDKSSGFVYKGSFLTNNVQLGLKMKF